MVSKGYLLGSITRVQDASWDLIYDPPRVVANITFEYDLHNLENIGTSFLGTIAASGNTDEQRSCLVVSSLIQFLATSVSENGRFSSSPLAVWIRLHVNSLTQFQSQETVSLSGSTAPFPTEELMGYRAGSSLVSLETSDAKLKLALAREVGSTVSPDLLIHQLLIRCLLVLGPATVIDMSQFHEEHPSHHLKTPVLLAVTLARLINHMPGAWSVESLVQGSKDILKVREAPAIVADMVKMLCRTWGVLEPGRAEHSEAIDAVGSGLVVIMTSFRYLVAAGARDVFAADLGNLIVSQL